MSGASSGTDGGKNGAGGRLPQRLPQRLPVRLFGVIAGFLLTAILVNISSNMIEQPDLPLWEPALWEVSSYIAILIFVPALWRQWRRFHWSRPGVQLFLAAPAAAFLLFSAGHIAVMALIRHAGYALAGETYDFSHGRLALVLIYESRKDFLTFVLATGMFWAYERLHRAEAPPPQARIELRADGRILYLSPHETVSAEAAGNYVELRLTHGKPLLLRATLADYADRLGPDFVRAHRSRLINRAHIREISVTAAGDPRLTLSDGREVAGSRRYRDRLRL